MGQNVWPCQSVARRQAEACCVPTTTWTSQGPTHVLYTCCRLKQVLKYWICLGEQVRGGEEAAASLAPEDEVEFDVVFNRKSGGFRAEDVELLCKAEDRRELGQVSPFPRTLHVSCKIFVSVCDHARLEVV